MLNLSRLRMLYELSLLGSISAVATSMNVTRPAVSQQLSLLEQEAGTTLFERSVRGVRLTSAGERVVRHVAELMAKMNALEADLAAETRELAGDLRIAAFGSAATSIIPPAIARLSRENPALRVQFVEMEPSTALRAAAAKQMDLVVAHDLMSADVLMSGLEQAPLTDDEFKVVVSADHRLAASGRRSVQLSELEHEEWALNQAATSFAEFLINACRMEGFTPRITCSCLNMAATLEFARTGKHVAVLPALGTTAVRNDPDFRVLSLRPLLIRRCFCAFAKGTGTHPAVMRAIEALQRASRIFT